MVKFLQLNGTSDYLKTNSITFDEIHMEFAARQTPTNEYYFDSRTGAANTYLYRNTSGIDFFSGSSFFAPFGHFWNDVQFSNNASTIDYNKRGTLHLVSSNGTDMTDDVVFFANNAGTASTCMEADVYSIKMLKDGVIVAFWDFTTGTATDKSGNNQVLTLNGGTWLDDGTGGTPTGTDGTTAFDVKQSIYSDSSLNVDTKLSLYSDSLTSADTKQALYQDGSLAVDNKQLIYSDSSVAYDSKQILFNDSFTLFDTLQEFFSDGIVGSTPFDMKFILYSDNFTAYDSKQTFYTEGTFQTDLHQAIYEAMSLSHDMNLVLYADTFLKADTNQQIYQDAFSLFDTKQVIFDVDKQIIGTIRLKGIQQLNVYLQGNQELYVHLQGKQALNVKLKGVIQ